MEPRGKVVREVLLAFAGATAACALLYLARNLHPFLASYLHTFVAVVFWLLPMRLLERAGRDPRAYGLTWRPLGRNLVWALCAIAIVFPLFLLGFRLYYTVLCATLRPALCARWAPSLWRSAGVHVAPNFALTAAAQLIVIAIPEEFFFRGYIQGRLREVFAPLPAIALSSLIFGLGHYLVDYDPQRLAVAFPAVLFGILRERTGSIAPGALFHASCNLYIDALHRTFFA
ncbi:MAG TPA: type II CAAX endopeptidase family protein [Polyangia bacterium]|nr:type II CAAX endopeptidase family protein [Polyangia bacterium]